MKSTLPLHDCPLNVGESVRVWLARLTKGAGYKDMYEGGTLRLKRDPFFYAIRLLLWLFNNALLKKETLVCGFNHR